MNEYSRDAIINIKQWLDREFVFLGLLCCRVIGVHEVKSHRRGTRGVVAQMQAQRMREGPHLISQGKETNLNNHSHWKMISMSGSCDVQGASSTLPIVPYLVSRWRLGYL